jgi:hypothetical protein
MRREAEKVVGPAGMKRIDDEIAAFFSATPAMPNSMPAPGSIPPPDFGWNFSRPEPHEMVALRAPMDTTGVDCGGQHYRIGNDRIVKVPAQECRVQFRDRKPR